MSSSKKFSTDIQLDDDEASRDVVLTDGAGHSSPPPRRCSLVSDVSVIHTESSSKEVSMIGGGTNRRIPCDSSTLSVVIGARRFQLSSDILSA